ncbi:hypothetical protein CANCADRAFT_22840 [Tortispora caseinolytica NRRL Y-17796]|uniref:Major facilitator superfamily (MFS) profile domain-containing protein n=1 Tax=Tortispora caseinolytica NRRL Y-17796 TaxID=767744 RepID=A0A1E4TL67_9ASCO|nr:hypothetical protein CANCADRAFT_22840 [Tortispora caseinolytica NRRL Y-17796]
MIENIDNNVEELIERVKDDNVVTFRNLDPPVTPEEERKVRRKMDLRLPPFVMLLYIVTWLDRSSLGNAALMNIQEDLNMSSSQFSFAVSIFYIGTLVADPFVNLGLHFFRPSLYIASAMFIWGGITMLMATVSNPQGMFALRFFLAVFEAVLIAGVPALFSTWYPRNEWGSRIMVYLSATPIAGAFGGWIAYGVAHIESHLPPWKWLFIIEGLLTVVVAFSCVYVLPDRPHNTRWLKPREREVMEWRMLRDGNRPQESMIEDIDNNVDELIERVKDDNIVAFRNLDPPVTPEEEKKEFLRSMADWRMCVNIVIFMTQNFSTYTLSTFTPLIVRSFGYSQVRSQLMVAPPFCVAFVMVFVVAPISDRLNRRASIYVVNSVVACAGYLMLALIPVENQSARYGALFLVIPAILSGVVLTLGNIQDNCCGDLKKSCAVGLYQCAGSAMGIATGYILPTADAPKYLRGFWTLFAMTAFGLVLSAFTSWSMDRENKRRDKKYGKPPTDIIIDFSELGEKHPFWRYTI